MKQIELRVIRQGEPKPCDSPRKVADLVYPKMYRKDRECFVVLHLSAMNQAVSIEVVSIGTLSTSLVHPREVFKSAIIASAAAIVIAHNHPSGSQGPSLEDKVTTERLIKSGELLGIPVMDHVIVTDTSYFSMREHGLMGAGQGVREPGPFGYVYPDIGSLLKEIPL